MRVSAGFGQLLVDSVEFGRDAEKAVHGDRGVEKFVQGMAQECRGARRRERGQDDRAIPAVVVRAPGVPQAGDGGLRGLVSTVQRKVALVTECGYEARVGQMRTLASGGELDDEESFDERAQGLAGRLNIKFNN